MLWMLHETRQILKHICWLAFDKFRVKQIGRSQPRWFFVWEKSLIYPTISRFWYKFLIKLWIRAFKSYHFHNLILAKWTLWAYPRNCVLASTQKTLIITPESETYLDPCQIFKMKCFIKRAKGINDPLAILAAYHRRCLTEFRISLCR